MDLLQQYQSGLYTEVWDELVASGPQVQEEPLFSEAQAVARETMRRVRHNIDCLIPRLRMIGYQFGYGWVQPYMDLPAYYQAGQFMQELEAERYTYRAYVAYTEFLELANTAPPLFISAHHNQEHIQFLDMLINGSLNKYDLKELLTEREHYESLPSASDQVQQFETITGPLPLSIKAWYEEVGGVNFVGMHPDWHNLVVPQLRSTQYGYRYDVGQKGPFGEASYLYPLYVLDPLYISPLNILIEKHRPFAPEKAMQDYLRLSDDDMGKYFEIPRGHYSVKIPCLEADADVAKSGAFFIPYLREVFRWGGFPGWATLSQRPQHDLDFLTKDLLLFRGVL